MPLVNLETCLQEKMAMYIPKNILYNSIPSLYNYNNYLFLYTLSQRRYDNNMCANELKCIAYIRIE